MRTEKFKVIEFIRQLIIAVDKELINFPKKENELKNRIRSNSYDLSFDREIITSKKYLKLANRIDDITKFTTGWLNTIVKNKT